MKAKLSNYYRKPGGTMVFVYIVIGTDVELANFKAAKEKEVTGSGKSAYVENEARQPLFFSTRPLSTNRAELIPLTITTTGRVVADDLTKVLTQEAKLDDYIMQEKAKIMAKAALSGGLNNLTDLTSTRPVATEQEVEEVLNGAIDTPVEVADNVPS